VELKWLEDLLVLLEKQPISRAAARRHFVQPPSGLPASSGTRSPQRAYRG
jgi:hypothetical protein